MPPRRPTTSQSRYGIWVLDRAGCELNSPATDGLASSGVFPPQRIATLPQSKIASPVQKSPRAVLTTYAAAPLRRKTQ